MSVSPRVQYSCVAGVVAEVLYPMAHPPLLITVTLSLPLPQAPGPESDSPLGGLPYLLKGFLEAIL